MFVAASFCNLAIGQNSADEVKRLYSRAKTAYSMGEYKDALNEYLQVQKMIPNYPDTYKAIGDVYGQLGTIDDLQEAIANYNKYLELSPNAQDRESVLEKIASLEYRSEKQTKQEQILDDLSGLWVSNLTGTTFLNPNPSFREIMKADIEVYVRAKNPYVMLKVEEIQKTGKFRATLLPESGIYRNSIIQKTINIVPTKDNSFRFVLADAVVYTPSASSYDFLRIGSSALGGSNLTQSLLQTSINAAQELDVPNNTQTAFNFDLKYNEGRLDGLLNIIQQHSSVQSNQTKQDDIFEISFTKQDMSYRVNFIDQIPDNEKLQILKSNPKAHQLYLKGVKQSKLSSSLAYGGLVLFGVGLVGALCAADMDGTAGNNSGFRDGYEGLGIVSTIVACGGTGMLVASLPLTFMGPAKQKKAVKMFKQDMEKNALSSEIKLSFGITPSGVGLALNF